MSDRAPVDRRRPKAKSASLGLGLSRSLASHSAGHWDEPGRPEEEQLKLAGFRVGGGLYGIDIMRIKEVIQARPYPIRNVPHAPGIVEGVIQLRGVVIPVVDLRKRFGTPIPEEDSRLNKLIIVSVRGRIIGLKIDRILGELRVPAGALRPAPSILRPQGGMPGEFFDGVCHSGDEMVFVVNLETIIDPRLHGKPSPPPSTSDAPAPAGHPREDT